MIIQLFTQKAMMNLCKVLRRAQLSFRLGGYKQVIFVEKVIEQNNGGDVIKYPEINISIEELPLVVRDYIKNAQEQKSIKQILHSVKDEQQLLRHINNSR